jgi:hypothetical protein
MTIAAARACRTRYKPRKDGDEGSTMLRTRRLSPWMGHSASPRVPTASLIAIMEDEAGRHGPRNVSSGPVNYNITCTGQ